MRYAAITGDSYTYNLGNSLLPADFYPHQAEKRLADLRIRNIGISGNTTAQMLGRMNGLVQYEIPAWAGIYGGTNDGGAANQSTVQASPSPTTTVFALGSGKAASMAKPGSWLTLNGQDRQVQSVSGDTVTLVTALSGAPTAGDAVVIATTKNLTAIGQFLRLRGCANVIIGLAHYCNYSGGDTVSTQAVGKAAERALQQAAATALNAPVVDFHAAMRARIVAGTDAQDYTATTVVDSVAANLFTVASTTGLAVGKMINADNQLGTIIDIAGKLVTTTGLRVPVDVGSTVSPSWHVADGNAHLSAYGGYVMGQILADRLIELGWE